MFLNAMIEVGDLVVSRITACVGIVFKEALKNNYVWVYWSTGAHKNKKCLESKQMLFKYEGGINGEHLLDW